MAQQLEEHQWENRVLIVKTTDEQSQKYQQQLKEFKKATEGLSERKLVLYQVVGNSYQLTDYQNPQANTSGKVSQALNQKFLKEKELFEVILIGLDGGVKRQKTTLLTQEELFGLIDAMPMRKAEMKK
ncbi:MAG: DUF4174 domain-containing protein [Thermonemataceae bacterium]